MRATGAFPAEPHRSPYAYRIIHRPKLGGQALASHLLHLNCAEVHVIECRMPVLPTAGCSVGVSYRPHGRGCYISGDKQFIVWVGEEDHLRIMCMKKGTMLNEVFDRLSTSIKVSQQLGTQSV